MTLKQQNILLQIAGIIFFMVQPILLPSKPYNLNGFYLGELFKDCFANLLIIGFGYANYLIFIPKIYFKEKYLMYLLLVIAGLFCTAILPSSIFTLDFAPPPLPPPNAQFPPPHESAFSKFQFWFSNIDHQVFLFCGVVFFSLMLKIRGRWFDTERARQETEINYLLAQINPHFLFNALNSIYALTIKENADNSGKSILQLSSLMRYIVTDARKEFVPLESEINCINDFIELQKLRLAANIKLQYTIEGNVLSKKIAPLLLIPFVENAFKHGVNPDEDSAIEIYIRIFANSIEMSVKNNKVTEVYESLGKSGLGISNAKNRLQLLYPDKHILVISEDVHFYLVSLSIFL